MRWRLWSQERTFSTWFDDQQSDHRVVGVQTFSEESAAAGNEPLITSLIGVVGMTKPDEVEAMCGVESVPVGPHSVP